MITPGPVYSEVISRASEYGGMVLVLILFGLISLTFNWYLIRRNTSLVDKVIGAMEQSIKSQGLMKEFIEQSEVRIKEHIRDIVEKKN